MNMDDTRRKQTLDELKEIIFESLEGVQVDVYLFGSWARNEEIQSSDIDIALQSSEEIPLYNMVKLRETIEESTLPYNVDIVNLAEANTDLAKNVRSEGVLWKGCSNDSQAQTGH